MNSYTVTQETIMNKLFACVLASLVALPALARPATETNKAAARRIFDQILTRGHFELAAELYAPDFVNHGRKRDVALAQDQAAARGWLQAFPDLVIRPEVILAENDLVAVVWHASGTNSGTGNGLPATGRRADGRGITIWRFAGGKVVEEWSEFSQLLLAQQLGLAPGGRPAPDKAVARAEQTALTKVRAPERERNRATVRSVFEEIVGAGKLELFESLYAPRFANHGIYGDGGVQAEIDGTKGLRQLAPDLKVEIPLTVAEGDLVAVVYTATGTNSGAALGLPATGRSFRVRGMSVMRVREGRITDEWSVLDQYQALEELGLLSKAGGSR
jgi:predicted ester cyclase